MILRSDKLQASRTGENKVHHCTTSTKKINFGRTKSTKGLKVSGNGGEGILLLEEDWPDFKGTKGSNQKSGRDNLTDGECTEKRL